MVGIFGVGQNFVNHYFGYLPVEGVSYKQEASDEWQTVDLALNVTDADTFAEVNNRGDITKPAEIIIKPQYLRNLCWTDEPQKRDVAG